MAHARRLRSNSVVYVCIYLVIATRKKRVKKILRKNRRLGVGSNRRFWNRRIASPKESISTHALTATHPSEL